MPCHCDPRAEAPSVRFPPEPTMLRWNQPLCRFLELRPALGSLPTPTKPQPEHDLPRPGTLIPAPSHPHDTQKPRIKPSLRSSGAPGNRTALPHPAAGGSLLADGRAVRDGAVGQRKRPLTWVGSTPLRSIFFSALDLMTVRRVINAVSWAHSRSILV